MRADCKRNRPTAVALLRGDGRGNFFSGSQPVVPVTQASCLHRPEGGTLRPASERGSQHGLHPAKAAGDTDKIGAIPGPRKKSPRRMSPAHRGGSSALWHAGRISHPYPE